MNDLNKPILIAGYGSVGRRHLRNLRVLGHKNIVLYRTGESTLPDDEISDVPVVHDLVKALEYKPMATIIANPTAFHMPVALAAAKAGSHLFIEKPISHTLDRVEELQRIVEKKGIIVQVGFQFRFHPQLQKIQQLLGKNTIGQVVSAQAYWGEYLPDWHPWEDYHQSYSARQELGGGVLLTLCHPFDYLRWLLGEVERVTAYQSKEGGLGIAVEESADVLLQFTNGAIGTVHVDYLQKPPEHSLRIIGQKGIIHWNNTDGSVRWVTSTDGKEKISRLPNDFDRNALFLSEMQHFLDCIIGDEKPRCTLDDGIKALNIILAAKNSIKEQKSIDIKI